ncbi:hypothetical protein PR048_024875 [Dryococelus australis]|uniref:Uncharacterized protein n=1 Tax=Dryococelus australis TaxID=614101 RepID=A0ABQ9GPT8_9NEOP|nr:hypothetical protein PR048_024875 [Dryococelus australis]
MTVESCTLLIWTKGIFQNWLNTSVVNLQECLRSGLEKTETVFSVISSFEIPRFSYDLERKKFIKSNDPPPELFAPPVDKASIYRNR